MSKFDQIHKEAEQEMKSVYQGMEVGKESEYAFKTGYFSGRLIVCIEENERLKKKIAEYEKS